jgi:dual specificity protein kinase YAK1
MSRQRQQQQQQAVAQQQQAQVAQHAAYANMQMNQYAAAQSPQATQNPYTMYGPNHQGAPPPYPAQAAQYGQPMNMMQPQQPRQYNQPQNLYAQATTRAGRQRATTMDQQQSGQSGIPPALQRVMSHLDPNAPVRLQPSPAYYPPPPDGAPESASSAARRRGSRAGNSNRNQNFVRNLEDRTLEEGFMGQNHWQ